MQKSATNPLFGTWRVTSMKIQLVGEQGERDMLGPHPKGYIIITPEPRMMAFLAADGRQPPANEAEAAAMLQTMIAYTGRVKLEEDKLTTDVELSWNQIYVGKPQIRFYKVNGDRLTIRSPEQEAGTIPGKRVVGILTFERHA
jgi:Lipocalin-like domain